MKNLFLFSFTLLCLLLLEKNVKAEPAIIIDEGAVVFTQPDFDSEPKFKLHAGEKVEVSKRNFGPFHRLKTKDGELGFIADSEYKVTSKAATTEKSNEQAAEKTADSPPEKKPKKQNPFSVTRYRGISISYVGYKEQTMGSQPMANLVFYGFKMAGPNLLVQGDMVTELNVDLFPGAPGFYQEGTGNSASGWLLHTDMIFESVFPQTRDIVTFAGFGPMFKYSHYNVSLTNSTGKTSAYDLEDMVLGAVFNVGFGLRMGQTCLRAEFKYDWEKTQYWGLGMSLLFPF
jgi:hypothetical protein